MKTNKQLNDIQEINQKVRDKIAILFKDLDGPKQIVLFNLINDLINNEIDQEKEYNK